MSHNNDILLLTHERPVLQAVNDAVRSSDRLAVGPVCTTVLEMHAALETTAYGCVIVDIDDAPEKILDELTSIVPQFPTTRFIVLAKEQRGDLLLKAMESGVRMFLSKSDVSTQLLPVLQRLLAVNPTRAGSRGQVVTMLSAGGGCGATTAAINLANELGLTVKEACLLIDLDLEYGSSATCLGVETKFGIADVVEDGSRIDANLIRSTAHAHSEHLQILVSPAAIDFEQPKSIQLEHLTTLITRCREIYPWTIIDAPRVSLSLASQMAAISAVTYIVLEANVKQLRVAKHIYTGLLERHIATERIVPLIVKCRGRSETIKLPEIQEAIGCTHVVQLAFDPVAADACINFGRTLADEAPRSVLRTAMTKLAETTRGSVRSAHAPVEVHA